MPLRVFRLTLAVLASALMSCAQNDKDKRDPLNTQGSMQRRMLKPDMSKSHPFEKAFNTASAGDRGGMKSWGRKGFHSNDVAGMKEFGGGSQSFKAGEFSQAGKSSRWGSKDSSYGSKANRMSGQNFDTKTSRFECQMAKQNSQMFQQGNDTYRTGEFQPAKKSLDDNKRVVIEVGAPGDSAPSANAYSEDEVKRLLGR